MRDDCRAAIDSDGDADNVPVADTRAGGTSSRVVSMTNSVTTFGVRVNGTRVYLSRGCLTYEHLAEYLALVRLGDWHTLSYVTHRLGFPPGHSAIW